MRANLFFLGPDILLRQLTFDANFRTRSLTLVVMVGRLVNLFPIVVAELTLSHMSEFTAVPHAEPSLTLMQYREIEIE